MSDPIDTEDPAAPSTTEIMSLTAFVVFRRRIRDDSACLALLREFNLHREECEGCPPWCDVAIAYGKRIAELMDIPVDWSEILPEQSPAKE